LKFEVEFEFEFEFEVEVEVEFEFEFEVEVEVEVEVELGRVPLLISRGSGYPALSPFRYRYITFRQHLLSLTRETYRRLSQFPNHPIPQSPT